MIKKKTNIFLLLIGIIFLSSLLLSYQLDKKSLWADELFSLIAGKKAINSYSELANFVKKDVHPPLYFYLLGKWMKLTGINDFSMRLFSVFSAILMLILLYLLTAKILSERIALLSVMLTSLSPFFILYARMARYYSFVGMLFLLNCYLFFQLLENEGKTIYTIFYIISSAALVSSFYPAISVVAAQNLYFFFLRQNKKTLKNWLLIQVILFLLIVLFCYPAINQLNRFKKDIPADISESFIGILTSSLDLFYEFSAGGTTFPWKIEGIFLFLINSTLFISGILLLKKEKKRIFNFLIIHFLMPYLITLFLFSFITKGHSFIFFASRCFYIFPIYTIIISCRLDKSKKFAFAFILILILAFNSFSIRNYFIDKSFLNPIYAIPSKEISSFISKNFGNSNNFVIAPTDTLIPEYLNRRKKELKVFSYRNRFNALKEISKNLPEYVIIAYLGRDRTKRLFSDDPAKKLYELGYLLYEEEKYVKIDPTYLMIKEFLLKRQSYKYKLILKIFRFKKENGNTSHL